jgi:hypothetical protein
MDLDRIVLPAPATETALAFDTLYAEGQRHGIESLSAYARQFLGHMGDAALRVRLADRASVCAERVSGRAFPCAAPAADHAVSSTAL